jgi:methionyl-tRNA formyltransferase
MISVVGFLSRPHGYAVLEELIKNKNITVKKIFTHSLNPLSQDPTRSIRSDFTKFQKICEKHKIEFDKIDSKDDKIIKIPKCDYIIEVSWRYFIPKEISLKANKKSFGIHRGKLPDYAGSHPIKQALLKNETNIILSAHNLLAEIDMGEIICEMKYPVCYDFKKTLDENIRRLRNDVTPLFPILIIQTLKKLEGKTI